MPYIHEFRNKHVLCAIRILFLVSLSTILRVEIIPLIHKTHTEAMQNTAHFWKPIPYPHHQNLLLLHWPPPNCPIPLITPTHAHPEPPTTHSSPKVWCQSCRDITQSISQIAWKTPPLPGPTIICSRGALQIASECLGQEPVLATSPPSRGPESRISYSCTKCIWKPLG